MDFSAAVASQPANLAASAFATRKAVQDIDLDPWRSGLLAVIAMGAGSHSAHALVHRLTRYGRRAINLDASDLDGRGAGADLADCYVFVSEGGRSRETISAAKLVAGRPRLALTNNPAGPLAEHVDVTVDLGHGPDSKVYTVGYTASLQSYGLLATALDTRDDGDDWDALPDLAAATLSEVAPAATTLAGVLTEVTAIDFVASGADRATAAEGALLFRESSRMMTADFNTYQYLHGPMESLTPAQAVVLIGDGREVELARYLVGRGIPTALITSQKMHPVDGLVMLEIPKAPALSSAILSMLPLQLTTGGLAAYKGLGIDGFLYHQDDTKIGPPPVK